jgi:thiol:disulfide interchange protein
MFSYISKKAIIGIVIFILIAVFVYTVCYKKVENMRNGKYHSLLKNEKLKDYLKDKDSVLVAILAPWCGHCKNMKKQNLLQDVSEQEFVVELDDKHTDAKDVMKAVDSKGFPTLCIYTQGDFFPYEGARDADSIKEAFKSRPK